MSIIENITNPAINALAWSLLHSLWQIVVIALLWRFSLWLSRKAPSNVRYNISVLALITIPLAFLVTLFRQYRIYSNVKQIVLFEFNEAAWINMQEESGIYVINKSYPTLLQNFDYYSVYIFWAYLTGILVLSAYFAVTYSKMYSLRRKSLTAIPDKWAVVLENVKQKAGIKASVSVLISSKVSIPVVIGIFKPMILLPLAVAGSISIQEVEYILMHELYHIRRRDQYINAIQYLLETLFFYHPVIWWISGNIRREREKCVDEWVVFQTKQPLEYAKTLLNLEEKRNMKLQGVLAASNSENNLLTRIKNVMHMKTRKINPGQKLAAIVVLLAALVSVAWFNPPYNINYAPNSPGEDLAWIESTRNDALSPAPDKPVSEKTSSEPERIVMDDGTSVNWNELSEKDKQEIRKAMEEVRLAMEEVNREVFEKINSPEFRAEMMQVQVEISRAMQEVNQELNSEEFKREMRQAREEIRRAMEEVNTELNSEEFRNEMLKAQEEIRRAMQEVNNEEFKQEMQKAREEIRKAMQEVNRELNSEEFKQGLREGGESLRIMLEQMEQVDWSGFGESMQIILEEVGKSLEVIGPTIQESLKNLKLDELMYEAEKSSEEKPE